MSVDRLEARYSLRVLHGIREVMEGVPSMAMYEAQFDDPELAKHMHEREQHLAKLDEHRNPYDPEID